MDDEMSIYGEMREALLGIAESLETGSFVMDDALLDGICQMIQSIYQLKCGAGDAFAKLYQKLLLAGKTEEAITVLQLLALHMTLFANDPTKMPKNEEDKIRAWSVFSRLGYYINQEKVRMWHEKHGYKEGVKPFQGKGVIYSAITGGYDNVKDPEYVSDDFDYILFTDDPHITSKVWKIVLLENKEGLDNVRLARKAKILGHEYLQEYDYSIWIDGKLQIRGDLREYIETYRRQEPMLCFNHYERDCAYEEKELCAKLEKDDPAIMEKQMEKYRQEGYPEKNGLVDTGILIRDHRDERVKRVMETWWSEILGGSKRDQISFGYACWKNDFVFDTSDLFIYINKFIAIDDHNVSA